jgi:hypothetical protein
MTGGYRLTSPVNEKEFINFTPYTMSIFQRSRASGLAL